MDKKQEEFFKSQLKFYKVDINAKNPWSASTLIYLDKFHIPLMHEVLNIIDHAVKTVKKKEDFRKYYENIKVFWTTQHDDTMAYWSWFHEGKPTEETVINFMPLAEILEITKKVNPDFEIRRSSMVTQSKIYLKYFS